MCVMNFCTLHSFFLLYFCSMNCHVNSELGFWLGKPDVPLWCYNKGSMIESNLCGGLIRELLSFRSGEILSRWLLFKDSRCDSQLSLQDESGGCTWYPSIICLLFINFVGFRSFSYGMTFLLHLFFPLGPKGRKSAFSSLLTEGKVPRCSCCCGYSE